MTSVDLNSPAVQSHLTILQGVISRMASNSAGCKTWCITIVSALLVVVADKAKPDYVWIAAIPIALFFFLDTYYLAYERNFRELYNEFIRKLHDGTASVDDVFIVAPARSTLQSTFAVMLSFSILPFYLLLLGTTGLAHRLLL